MITVSRVFVRISPFDLLAIKLISSGMACKIAIAFANGILKIAVMKQHVSITSITPRASTNFINFFGKKNNGNLKRSPKNIKHDTTISPLMKID